MATFKFELVSPERILFSGEIVSVIIPSVEGEMTVLAGHAPLVATLKTGILFVQTTENNGKEFFVNGGLVEINQASTTVLAEQARFLEDVDAAVLEAEILTVETRIDGAHTDEDKKRLRETLSQLREFKHVFESRKVA